MLDFKVIDRKGQDICKFKQEGSTIGDLLKKILKESPSLSKFLILYFTIVHRQENIKRHQQNETHCWRRQRQTSIRQTTNGRIILQWPGKKNWNNSGIQGSRTLDFMEACIRNRVLRTYIDYSVFNAILEIDLRQN